MSESPMLEGVPEPKPDPVRELLLAALGWLEEAAQTPVEAYTDAQALANLRQADQLLTVMQKVQRALEREADRLGLTPLPGEGVPRDADLQQVLESARALGVQLRQGVVPGRGA